MVFCLCAVMNSFACADQAIQHLDPKLLMPATIPAMVQNGNFSIISKYLSVILQFGGFDASQGKNQNIGIDSLIGDRFTVDQHHDQNYFVGLGIYIDAIDREKFKLMYGVNAFYFAHTKVEGNVIQEEMFTNLSYRYFIRHIPIFIAAKALINMNSSKYNFILDFGVGPNFLKIYNFAEHSLDGGVTIPDRIFSGQSAVVAAATAGVGIRINDVLNHMPVELSYRLFYLGKAKFNKLSDQVQNSLTTGTIIANALMLSISV